MPHMKTLSHLRRLLRHCSQPHPNQGWELPKRFDKPKRNKGPLQQWLTVHSSMDFLSLFIVTSLNRQITMLSYFPGDAGIAVFETPAGLH